MSPEVERISKQLEMLAEASLAFLNEHRNKLSPEQREKLRRIARGALNRAHDLPRLVEENHDAWIKRTWKFIAAASRTIAALLELNYVDDD